MVRRHEYHHSKDSPELWPLLSACQTPQRVAAYTTMTYLICLSGAVKTHKHHFYIISTHFKELVLKLY